MTKETKSKIAWSFFGASIVLELAAIWLGNEKLALSGGVTFIASYVMCMAWLWARA